MFAVLLLLISIALASMVECSVNEPIKELILSEKEKIAFEKFKNAVYGSIPKNLPLLSEDIYLVRFIRAKRLDVDLAKKEFFEIFGSSIVLSFLDKINATNIMKMDFSDIAENAVYDISSVDLQGRPVIYITMRDGGWNIRRAVLLGHTKRLTMYIYKSVLEMAYKLMDVRKKNANITQFVILIDLTGFNIINHSCGLCAATYFQLIEIHEKWIPGFVSDIIFINANPAFYTLGNVIIRPVVSHQTKSALKVFGMNKQVWKRFLDTKIDPSQLPRYLGGTKSDD